MDGDINNISVIHGITDRIEQLEKKVIALEKELSGHKVTSGALSSTQKQEDYIELQLNLPWQGREEGIERKIGIYGLAWMGNIVLFLGMAFLTHFLSVQGFTMASFIIGILVFAGMIFAERFLGKSYVYLSSVLRLSAQVMLFYTFVRMHFFTGHPLISNKTTAIILLFMVIFYQYFDSVKRRSEGFAILALLMSVTLAVLSDTTHIMLPVVTGAAVFSIFFFNKFQWSGLLIFSVILTYLIFLMWMAGNPLMGHEFRAMSHHQFSYLYLAFVAAVFSLVTLVKKHEGFPDTIIISTVLLNGLGFSITLCLFVITFFPANYIWVFISISVFCLGFSALLKFRSPWKYSPAFYALYSFVAISITFYGLYGFPHVYLFLSCQSLLVVAISLWFRSRIMIVMNLLMFLMIMAGYYLNSVSFTIIDFSFPVIAFFSAWIINWQRERLKIKTEFIRNTYLMVIFITLLYALFKVVPAEYTTLSWALAAVLYLVISILLKNVKFRYMMFGTLIVTAIHLFIFDLAKTGMVFRIIAFLALAMISIGISVYYVRKKTGQ